ncbi:MAG: DUF998 domain-containing protein [Micrococcaceae bacterium]|nr:DUF998 domain-containing protein [Micrococcaceae bacterium]
MTQRTPVTARRRFAAWAMAGVAIYVLVDIVLQLLPPHYSAISDAESNLAVGPFGWIMNVNFCGRAITTLCAISAISRVGPASRLRGAGVALMFVGGLCSAVLAFFPADVDAGSTGTTTVLGTVHLCVAAGGFLAALAGILVLTRWLRLEPSLARAFPAALALALVAAFGLAFLATSILMWPLVLGLAERMCLMGILGWVMVVCASIRSLDPRR